MKKIISKKLIIIAAAVIVALSAIFAPRPVYAFAKDDDLSVSVAQVQEILHDFMFQNQNRYSFNLDGKSGEKRAAEYIAEMLKEFGYSDTQIQIQEFSAQFQTTQGSFFQEAQTETRHSQNVICSIKGSSSQKIIVGCNYDNVYTDDLNTGTMFSGTAVAICLALGKQLQDAQNLPFSIDIVFFGAGYHDYEGSVAYIDKNGLKNLMAMFNVSRIGGESTYIYCDEVKTDLQGYLLSKGGKAMPARVPTLNIEFVSGYPYTHYGMVGNHSAFMGNGVKTANIFGGYYNSLSLSDYEGSAKILGKDTVENMEKEYPDCYVKMQSAANIILKSITDTSLTAALNSPTAHDSIFIKRWVAYVIFGVITALALAGFYFVGKGLIKKYPPVLKRGRLAIFGAEYETPKDNEVIIDIKPKSPFDQP